MKFCTHYFPFMLWLPWKFREVLFNILEWDHLTCNTILRRSYNGFMERNICIYLPHVKWSNFSSQDKNGKNCVYNFMKIGWELTEKSAKFIHHGWCESDYNCLHSKYALLHKYVWHLCDINAWSVQTLLVLIILGPFIWFRASFKSNSNWNVICSWKVRLQFQVQMPKK